jgi:hypothetical protein
LGERSFYWLAPMGVQKAYQYCALNV